MSLRFFADHCVPQAIVVSLRDGGHQVFRLRDHIPTDAPDTVVIAQAQRLDSILVSVNGDFSDIVAYPPSAYAGIMALQIRNHPEIIPALMSRLHRYIASQPTMEYYVGKLLLIAVHRIRIRA